MDIPKQKAHSLWVEVTESPYETAVKILKRKCIKCMEIHSHHIMPAIPSSQDDESEVMPILYAIIGSVDKFFPDLIVRTYDMDSGKHIKLNPLSIFENPFFNTLPDYDYSVVEVKL